MSESEQKIIDYLQRTLAETGFQQQVASDTALLGSGLIDSMGLVGLIEFLETSFGLKIGESELAPDLFETPASIASFVDQHQA